MRKAGATIAANNGASAHQLMAIFGWDTIKEAEKYTAKADQRRLAESAMHLLDVRYTLRGLLAEQIGYLGKRWCPGAELNHRHLHFQF